MRENGPNTHDDTHPILCGFTMLLQIVTLRDARTPLNKKAMDCN